MKLQSLPQTSIKRHVLGYNYSKRSESKEFSSLFTERDWNIFVKGHASVGEVYKKTGGDAYELANLRATLVAKTLIEKGVSANKITIVSYGDSRPLKISGSGGGRSDRLSQRVEFSIRKVDLETKGRKVDAF